ncbi:carboxypeptidase-like regulatory domain-containing protein [Aurantibacillus circumpalustris]|uniref:carboxypeptidase-like regulatory domain-containing protein n=1 Tax=Aurantibacillus circumpalustris TaxID=3036359 RepID=UPI00295C2D83|nr:carboxypeptidase-like regulatory domain-containing protein [Aurantibacillus circumpalustris]
MKKIVCIFLFVFCCKHISAIVPALEREVNLFLNNESFGNVLIKIQEQTGLIFSYKPSIVKGIGLITLNLSHKSVREALALMLPKSVTYKAKNNYIILKEKPVEVNPKKTEISGYVIDKETEKKVANVTIYDKESLQSVNTDEYGYYSISLPSNNDKISVNKENYKDTIFSLVNVKENKLNNITMVPVNDSVRKNDSLVWKDKFRDIGLYTSNVYKKIKGFVNTINVRDTIERNFQVSLIPFVGTNRKLSGNVVNRTSFNILGGVAKGSHGIEVGGLFNIDRNTVKGFQIAGLFNIVGDSVKGAQAAGVFNITGKSAAGLQVAMLMNVNAGTQKGVQFAGLMNLNSKSSNGISVAGLMNITGTAKGLQASFMGNINDTLKGAALSSVFNVTDYGINSIQISNGFNKQNHGSSLLQVAALFNSTNYLKGIQIAPFNFADSAVGVPVGLFSFVKKGVHQIELSADELFTLNLSFRSGVPHFYNIFSIGYEPGSDLKLWQLGYGVGTSFKIKKKLRSDITVTMHHISAGDFYFATNDIYKAYLGLEYKFGKKFSIAGGPTFNVLRSDALLPDYPVYQNISPNYLFDQTNSNNFNLKGWIGGRLALRFL